MPWGAMEKVTETNLELPEVRANLCGLIPLTHRCIQKLESKPAIVAENFIKPKPDEVRWVQVLQSL